MLAIRPFIILTLTALALSGCGMVGEIQQPDDFADVPSGLLYECEVLMVPRATAAEGVPLSEGNLAALSLDAHRVLTQMVYPYQLPPVLEVGTPHRGISGMIEIRVDNLERLRRRRWGWIGPGQNIVSLSGSVRFVNGITDEPLGDWIDLSEHIGPAEGANLRVALRALAQQVASFVLRDIQGL